MIKSRVTLALLLISALSAHATISLPAIFGDNMVLQADKPLPFWGTAEPGEQVTVQLYGEDGLISKTAATADAKGQWKATLPACASGLNGKVTIVGEASEPVRFENVLTGQVWVCSGQSNMNFPLKNASNLDAALEQANNDQIRLFTVINNTSETPLDELQGQWVLCTRDTARDFSAVGYYFGVELNQYLGQPIGLIKTAWGGTPVEAWTPMDALENEPAAADMLETYQKFQKDPESMKDSKGRPIYREKMQKAPSWLYNAMVHPFIPYAIEGVIWYQGEANAGKPDEYKATFPLMIESWRARWGQGDFPFLYVELAGFRKQQSEPSEGGWANIREAQAEALTLPNTGVATAVDVGMQKDIHPKDKETVGKRLALAAQGLVYGKEGITQSPRLKNYKIEGDRVVLNFFDAGQGLHYTPVDGKSGFAIRGAEGDWHWADTQVDGGTITVSSPEVSQPVAVRYAWASFPYNTVYNNMGLPLLPFRTDKDS